VGSLVMQRPLFPRMVELLDRVMWGSTM
jgi:hypothetical protein